MKLGINSLRNSRKYTDEWKHIMNNSPLKKDWVRVEIKMGNLKKALGKNLKSQQTYKSI